MVQEVFVMSAVRSAIGTFNGSLADFQACELAGLVMREAVARAHLDPELLEYVTVGTTMPTDARYPYVSRVASIQAGLPMTSTAMQLNRLCASGLQAVVTTAQNIRLGDVAAGIGGGVEVMSRAAYMLPALRSGARMGDTQAFDGMLSILTDPFGVGHMGVTAENLATKHGITREEQDACAVESHRRAGVAIAEGRFAGQIVPIVKKTRKGEVVFDTDEHCKPETTMESLGKLRPAFKKDGGTVTAGNASGINDGAAFLVLANGEVAARSDRKPMARLVSYAVSGVCNDVMGEGPVPATRAALKKAGLSLDAMDVIESNEAFAAQALTVAKVLGLDPAKTNPNGGAIALGHPVGCSGAFIATKALHELQRVQGRYALVTMCIGGGQGIAVIFERV